MAKRITVYNLVIHHRHGDDHYSSRNSEENFNDLFEYVETWWDDAEMEREIPKDKQTAIDEYFEVDTGMGDVESYEEWEAVV